jgi:ABC-type metal ion transport system, periplasmic component/surface adhesin
MPNKRLLYITLILLITFALAIPAGAQQAQEKIKVVCTTSVLMDPVIYIGGDKVEAISIADPALCPDVQSDIIPGRIQKNADFIRVADMFVAFNDSNDINFNIPAVEKYMSSNNYGAVAWKKISNPSAGWNTPDTAKAMAAQVKGWLVEKDPANQSYYEQRYNDYLKTFDAIQPAVAEKAQLNGTKVIVMMWQMEPVQKWLGMSVVNFFAPEFVMNGAKTPDKIVDDINANPEDYQDVTYVIENMQSGELAKGIEEALHDKGIDAKRVIFTNFPYSVDNVKTMADVLNYNKNLVLQGGATATPTQAATPTATPAPAGMLPLAGGLLIGAAFILYQARKD